MNNSILDSAMNMRFVELSEMQNKLLDMTEKNIITIKDASSSGSVEFDMQIKSIIRCNSKINELINDMSALKSIISSSFLIDR